MGSRHNLDGLMREQEYVDAKIVDSPYGYKMVIPVFNEAVPAFYVGRVMETVEAFLDAYTVACGTSLGPESLYVDGNLSICLDWKVPPEQRYRLYVIIVAGEGNGVKEQDYIIEAPVLPTDEHFAEFRQCFLDMFEAMIGNR